MGRTELLQQKTEREKALKEIDEKYKTPDGLKYDLFKENGEKEGHIEYTPQNDNVELYTTRMGKSIINGTVLKSLHEALGRLLNE